MPQFPCLNAGFCGRCSVVHCHSGGEKYFSIHGYFGWVFFLVLMGCCWNIGCVWQEMCCGVSDCTTEHNSRQWWVIFNRPPCGRPVGSRGLCWGVSRSIACSRFGGNFSGFGLSTRDFFCSVKRIGLREVHSSKVEITLVSWAMENPASLNLPVHHLGAALWRRWFTAEAGWGPAVTR